MLPTMRHRPRRSTPSRWPSFQPWLSQLEERCLLTINEFPIPQVASMPKGIALGSDGAMWFTESNTSASKIGRVTAGGVFTEYSIPQTAAIPTGIAAGPDGALWFTMNNTSVNKIGRVTTGGVFTLYNIPTPASLPLGITAGPDGAMWFVMSNTSVNKIGRITMAGVFTEYTIPVPASIPIDIAAGSDGALWFTMSNTSVNRIGRITTSGVFTTYLIPQAASIPLGITPGPDGALWFVESNTSVSKIGRVTTSGVFTEYSIPYTAAIPTDIATGPDNALYFTMNNSSVNRIGRVTTSGVFSDEQIPTIASRPEGIARGPGGVWFVSNNTGVNKIGQKVVGAGTATNFLVDAPASSTAGTSFSVTVTARDQNNNVATGYRGTVRFTSSDPLATLPANYTFTTADNGVHTFTNGVSLRTAGSRTVTATDTVTGSITGSDTVTVNPASASVLALSALPASVTAGVAASVTVTARDAFGNTAPSYRGTVRFTSNDTQATLPPNYTFTAGDNGVHTFTNAVTLRTAGSRSVTVTDTVTGSMTASSNTTVNPAAASVIQLTNVPASRTAGSAFSPTVTARDAFGNVATGYRGTVRFTTSDPSGGTLPANYTFTAGDNGVHTFTNGVTLYVAGPQSLTVRDTANATINDTKNLTINPAAVYYYYVYEGDTSLPPPTVTQYVAFPFYIFPFDIYFNWITTYAGTINFFSYDSLAVYPFTYTFTGSEGGIGVPGDVSFGTEGIQDLWVYDNALTAFGLGQYDVIAPDGSPGPGRGGAGAGSGDVIDPLLGPQGQTAPGVGLPPHMHDQLFTQPLPVDLEIGLPVVRQIAEVASPRLAIPTPPPDPFDAVLTEVFRSV